MMNRRTSSLKLNSDKSKVMMLNVEEGLDCEICVAGMRSEHLSEFKYFGCDLDESECSRKVANGRRVEGAIRFLVNARSLQLECTRILQESLLVHVLMCGSETMTCKEKERSRIRVVQMDNLRGLLGIRKMDKSRLHG